MNVQKRTDNFKGHIHLSLLTEQISEIRPRPFSSRHVSHFAETRESANERPHDTASILVHLRCQARWVDLRKTDGTSRAATCRQHVDKSGCLCAPPPPNDIGFPWRISKYFASLSARATDQHSTIRSRGPWASQTCRGEG